MLTRLERTSGVPSRPGLSWFGPGYPRHMLGTGTDHVVALSRYWVGSMGLDLRCIGV